MKIHSRKLRNAKWDLTLPLADARRDDELVSIGDSQMLRWIDELNGITDAEKTARSLKKEIKRLKKSEHSFQNKKEIKRLYSELDKVQFKPDYMCLIIDRVSDYRRACKGFKINGIKYVRLLGTNGGVKASTIVFVSERLAPELKRRIENGRDPEKKFIPAKFEAYRALTCSGSTPVSMPYGIAVVNDCETSFVEDVISMRDGDGDEPIMEYTYGAEITLDESDGYGIMLPSLAERWSKELGLNYTAAGMNTRFSWEKGMVFTFDYLDFADNVAGTRMIKDAWGNNVDLGQTELILTTSMLKLWNAYPDLETYLKCCAENHYTFGVPKVCPEELENERGLNYQFIQCYDLDEDDIEKLTAHTREVFSDVLTGDYARAVLFLKGVGLNEHNVDYIDDDFVKAMMIDKRVFDDPFVKRTIYHMIRKRINDAKVGVLMVHGNYSIVCGDPYALCQSMFGLPVTGLLKKGEIYNRYWIDDGADEVMCFRAPMTSINNVRKAKVARGEQPEYWYRYMNTCTLFNCWDTMAAALNGMD